MLSDESLGPIIVHGVNTIRYANDEFLTLVGADSREAVIGERVTKFVAPEYHDPLTTQFERIAREEVPTLGLAVELESVKTTDTTAIAISSAIDWNGTLHVHTSFIDVEERGHGSGIALRDHAMNEAPVGITIADATEEDEPLIYVNDGFVELTGYPRAECIGRNCRFLQGEDTREEPVTEMRAAIDAGRPVSVKLRNYRKDGTMFWNSVSIVPVEDETGDVTHFIGFQEDITTSKVYEREKGLFERHAEAADHAMFITDREGTIEYVNPAFERMTGYTAEEAVGRTPRLLKSDQQDAAFYQRLWETLTAGEIWEAEITNRTKSGELYRVDQTIVPITGDRGEITHFVAIERDVTDDQLTQQVLAVMDRVMRHNVRTALSVIDGYAELLEGDLNESEHHAAIEQIREAAASLEKSTEKFLPIRDLIMGKSDSRRVPLASVADTVRESREIFEEATIDLRMDVEGTPTVRHLEVIELALEEAIENAVLHSDRATPHVTVTVSWGPDNQEALVTVADDGPGIPEQEWRVIREGTETPLLHGSGIGLWLIDWAITAVGGTVELSANDPRGSVLTFRIPATADSE